jgi:hypothetical protein
LSQFPLFSALKPRFQTRPYPEQFGCEGGQAHQVVREGKHQHYALHLGELTHPKLLQTAVARLRVDAFGRGRAPLLTRPFDSLATVRAERVVAIQ